MTKQSSNLMARPPKPRCLIAWWGSLERGGETAGDLRAVQQMAGLVLSQQMDVAIATICAYRELNHYRCVRWQEVEPSSVDLLMFVCGPLIGDSVSFQALVARFQNAASLAVGVSVLPQTSPSAWQGFDRILARDGGFGTPLGDLAVFSTVDPRHPLQVQRIGLCLRGAQREYGLEASLHAEADARVRAAVGRFGGEVVMIDTRLHGVEDAADRIESEFEAVDVVVTTRMHGALLGLAKGKPTLGIDQVRHGAKLTSVLHQIGWPAVIAANASETDLVRALDFLQSDQVAAAIAKSQNTAASRQLLAYYAVCCAIQEMLPRDYEE